MTNSEKQLYIDNLIYPLASSWREFVTVTGAKLLSFDENTCQKILFKVPRGYCANKAQNIELFVNHNDLYCVNFYNSKMKLIGKLEDIYVSDLEEIFRDKTALATRFPRLCF